MLSLSSIPSPMFVKEAEKKKGQLKELKVPKLRLLKYRLLFPASNLQALMSAVEKLKAPLRCFWRRTQSERRGNEFGAIQVTRGGDAELSKGTSDS